MKKKYVAIVGAVGIAGAGIWGLGMRGTISVAAQEANNSNDERIGVLEQMVEDLQAQVESLREGGACRRARLSLGTPRGIGI